MAFTNDSDKVVYIADPDGIGQKELFVVDLDHAGNTFKISETMPTLLDQVEDFYLTPSGETVAAPFATRNTAGITDAADIPSL